jgi:2-polyprenyl-6-methoxyphenol hydroxylase-like FAD-dependent oxidoreductase
MGQTLRVTSAIVIGASVSGLLAARALSDVVDEVVVMERERLTDAPSPRGHVVQVAKSFNLVLNLVEPTSALVRPAVLARVLASSVPGRRRRSQVSHPRVGPRGTA